LEGGFGNGEVACFVLRWEARAFAYSYCYDRLEDCIVSSTNYYRHARAYLSVLPKKLVLLFPFLYSYVLQMRSLGFMKKHPIHSACERGIDNLQRARGTNEHHDKTVGQR
jgi:hypothetical protein